ncbi:MAG: cellulase family glycosylhydrolase, partial [Planctomycetaceae bacterium]|nr:cellulase family glycosylhydrolase [Planctomycetaceae bacterium]
MFKKVFYKNVLSVMTIFVSLFLVFMSTVVFADDAAQLSDGQWSIEKANGWYAQQQWIVGCNFLPSTAINDIEMWQDETFDLKTIDHELGLARAWGINSVRVFLNYVVWEAEAEKLKSNFKKFLDVAEKHGISVMPVLFDDCNFSGNIAKAGKQPEPIENYYANGWVSSPPAAMVRDESQWQKLKEYEQDMIRTFGSDKRIIIWDIYNEPGDRNSKLKNELLKNVFAWARELKPTQPLTSGIHGDWNGKLSLLMRGSSDIVTFHHYGVKSDFEQKIKWAQEAGRPVICTEWLNRPGKNSVADILPVLKETKTGGYLWGLVNGKTQTHLQWGSTPQRPRLGAWQHDLMHNNGAVYNPSELHLFRTLAENFVTDKDEVLFPKVDLQLKEGQWSIAKATDWYAQQQRIVGCNFLPNTAVNDVEMWQDETFDLKTIDQELGFAKEWGINSVRVFLNYVVWEAEAEKFKSNFKKFLDVAEKHGISVMPILFDDCNFSGNVAKIGKQQDPVQGVHNSGWVSSPPAALVRDESQWQKLKDYEQDMIRTFGSDKRIIIWDLYNEPGNSGNKLKLLENIFAWARELKPNQPLTIGAFHDWDSALSKLMRNNSDIVSFHSYGNKAEVESRIQWAQSTGRPAVCTEWLRRQGGNTPQIILPLFNSYKIGGYNWGLVAGRTQTYFHWGSRKGTPEPSVWQHDLIRQNGTPYSLSELFFYKKMSGQIGVNENETVLLPTSESNPRAWKYTESNMSDKNWYAKDFDDSDWSSGNAPFGKSEPNINR